MDAAFIDEVMRIAVWMYGHHDQQRVIGDLGNPGGNHPIKFFLIKRGQNIDPVGHVPQGSDPFIFHGVFPLRHINTRFIEYRLTKIWGAKPEFLSVH